MVIKGILDVNDPFDGFAPDVDASGLTVLVSGAGIPDFNLVWTGSECTSTRRGTTRLVLECRTGNRSLKAKFKPVPGVIAPNVFQVKLAARKLGFPPALTADPVTVTLQTATGPDRGDTIGETGTCSTSKSGKSATCFERGIISD